MKPFWARRDEVVSILGAFISHLMRNRVPVIGGRVAMGASTTVCNL